MYYKQIGNPPQLVELRCYRGSKVDLWRHNDVITILGVIWHHVHRHNSTQPIHANYTTRKSIARVWGVHFITTMTSKRRHHCLRAHYWGVCQGLRNDMAVGFHKFIILDLVEWTWNSPWLPKWTYCTPLRRIWGPIMTSLLFVHISDVLNT